MPKPRLGAPTAERHCGIGRRDKMPLASRQVQHGNRPCAARETVILLAVALMLALGACASDSGDGRTPQLVAPTRNLAFPADSTITPVNIENQGGSPISCMLADGQSLPAGLALGLSSDRSTCALSGTPTAQQAQSGYTIIARNDAGESRVDLQISVTATRLSSCASGSDASQRRATYRVSFLSIWSAGNNGVAPPANAGFGALIGASHNSDFSLWALNSVASDAFEAMVEEGDGASLRNILMGEIDNQQVGGLIEGAALARAAGSINVLAEVRCEYPLLSLAMRIEPSPDWFLGLNSVRLTDEGEEWLDRSVHDLFIYDAGTEVGNRFVTSGADQNPPAMVSRLAGNAAIGFTTGRERIGQIVVAREGN